MKILPLLLSLCLVHVAIAENDPAELERLRQQWEKSVATEVEKKNKIYLKALEKLQKKFTGANNLAAAVAVNDEIKMVRLLKPEQQRKSPLDGVWYSYIGTKKWMKVINGDRLVDENGITKYTVENGIFKAQHEMGWWWKLKINSDNPDVMEGVDKGGNKNKWVRVKW